MDTEPMEQYDTSDIVLRKLLVYGHVCVTEMSDVTTPQNTPIKMKKTWERNIL